MPLTLDAIEEKLNYVSKMLTMQQEHIIHLKRDLQKQKEVSAATAQAAETVPATPSTGVPTHYSSKPCWPAPPGFEWVLEEGVGMWTLGKVQGQQERGQETVPPSEAGAGHLSAVSALSETDERAAYLRGFEAAKALLLAVKPEPERGPDNFLWVNVYQLDSGEFYSSEGYDRKEDAARCAQLDGKRKLCARVRVWFNEGQFDD
jgi:hypothetical protein